MLDSIAKPCLNSPAKPIRLHEIDLYVTMKCNLACSFCSVRANEHQEEELSLSRILGLISEAHEMGLQELHLIGGEPTLRTDLEEIVKYAVSKGIKTRLISNGTLLSRKRLIQLVEAGMGNIMLSVDGMKETHNLMRGSASAWQKTMECILECVDLGLQTRVSSVAFRNNQDEIPELIEKVAGMGVDIFSVFLGSPLGRGENWKDQVLTAQEWKCFLQRILEDISVSRYGSSIQIIAEQGFLWPETKNYNLEQMQGRGTGCSTLLTDYDYLIVRADGNLYQCVFFMQDGVPIGNIMNQPLEMALEMARKRKIYQKFTQVGNDCSACNWNVDCGGGCRGYSQLYTGDWHQPDPRCSMTENAVRPPNYPLCPIAKLNLRSMQIAGSSELALLQ